MSTSGGNGIMATARSRLAPSVVRVYLKGGLGNQLFSLAAALQLAHEFQSEVVASTALLQRHAIDTASATKWNLQVGQLAGELFTVDASKFQSVRGSTLTSKTLSLMEELSKRMPAVSHKLGVLTFQNLQRKWLLDKTPKVVRLMGLFMHAGVARDSSATLKAHLENLRDPSEAYVGLKEEIAETQPNIIHYRSGDYENMRALYGSLSRGYFRRAANQLGFESEYWLFTDHHDAGSLLRDLPIKISRLVDRNQPITALETMHLLGMGSGFIGSNSTFSFWGALLANSSTQRIFPNAMDARHRISALVPEERSWQILDSTS